MAVKTNSAGLVTPSKQIAATQPTTPVATRPVAESYTPNISQSLNLYGTPAVNARPAAPVPTVKKTTTTIPAAKTDAQMAADAQAILDKLGAISTRVDELGGSTTTGGGGVVSEPVTPITPTVTKKEIIPNVAYDTIQKILESYRITGLASVLETIRDEYPEASSAELMTLLQFDPRYNAKFNERFAGNAIRQKAGKPVLSPGEYLKLEQAYEKIFTSYNLPKFATQTYYDSFIVGDTDPTEITERIQMAYDRVMGDDVVNTAFKKFYPSLGLGDIVTGMLDTANQLPALQQKVKAAEIGGAALRQGLTASELATAAEKTAGFGNVTTSTLGADVLAKQGLTKAQAEEGYQRIAQVLPTSEKLSSIYGNTADQYGRLEAEQEQLQGLASAKRKREQLSALELGQFRKSSVLGASALKSATNI
jgi:hypothetical protein